MNGFITLIFWLIGAALAIGFTVLAIGIEWWIGRYAHELLVRWFL